MSADAYNARELAAGRINAGHLTAMARCAQRELGLTTDGMVGEKTRAALMGARAEEVTPISPPASEPSDQRTEAFGEFDGPLVKIPRGRSEVLAAFGDPGTKASPNRRWARENIITVRDLPGVPRKWFFQVHKLAEPYMREGLRRASELSKYEIDRAGCWVLRHIQHNPGKPLSLHSWGIAVDFDAGRNRARTFKRGQGPRPWSDEWNELWPKGVDQAFVEGMESVGFTWGGVWGHSGGDFAGRANACSYFDPMHFELRTR